MRGVVACFICFGFTASLNTQPDTRLRSAETLVEPGDGTVDASRLKPYDNAFVATQTLADGRSMTPGIWTDQLRIRDVNNRRAWVRIQTLGYFNGLVMTSVNVFDPKTFAPISSVLINPDGSKESWTFSPSSAEGHLTSAEGVKSVKTISVGRPSFDFNCCMRSLMPAALHLSLGKEFALRGIVAADGDPEIVRFHVRARQRIRAGYRGKLNTWVVDSPVPGGGTVSFWIADTPPYVARMTLRDVPGNRTSTGLHYDQSFDMLGP